MSAGPRVIEPAIWDGRRPLFWDASWSCSARHASAVGRVLPLWHSHAMSRIRVSTTVDEDLLAEARRVATAPSDAALLDQALTALLAQHRRAEVDQAYRAYDEHPINEPDEWGDLASFRAATATS